MYQKAYVEFFASPEAFKALEGRVKQHPSLTYLAVDSKGDFHSNQVPPPD